jgi:hypothetical protein
MLEGPALPGALAVGRALLDMQYRVGTAAAAAAAAESSSGSVHVLTDGLPKQLGGLQQQQQQRRRRRQDAGPCSSPTRGLADII